MGVYGGFYKGEKKKKKKDLKKNIPVTTGLGAPTIKMPEIISKKDKNF